MRDEPDLPQCVLRVVQQSLLFRLSFPILGGRQDKSARFLSSFYITQEPLPVTAYWKSGRGELVDSPLPSYVGDKI